MSDSLTPHPYQWAIDGPPIGRWYTENGTANILMFAEFEFFSDGTGIFREQSQLSHTQKCKFFWEFIRPGVLKTFEYIFESEDPYYFDDGSNDPSNPDNWDYTNYCTSWTTIDMGLKVPTLVSCARGENGEISEVFDSFWITVIGGVTFAGEKETSKPD